MTATDTDETPQDGVWVVASLEYDGPAVVQSIHRTQDAANTANYGDWHKVAFVPYGDDVHLHL